MLYGTSENRCHWHHLYTYNNPNGQPSNRPTSLIRLPGGPTAKWSQIGAALMFLRIHLLSSNLENKAYIPLRRETIRVVSWRWLTPLTPHFRLGDTNMLVYENAKTPDAKPKIYVLPEAKPNAKPNIGCVGSQRKILASAMYISFFVL